MDDPGGGTDSSSDVNNDDKDCKQRKELVEIIANLNNKHNDKTNLPELRPEVMMKRTAPEKISKDDGGEEEKTYLPEQQEDGVKTALKSPDVSLEKENWIDNMHEINKNLYREENSSSDDDGHTASNSRNGHNDEIKFLDTEEDNSYMKKRKRIRILKDVQVVPPFDADGSPNPGTSKQVDEISDDSDAPYASVKKRKRTPKMADFSRLKRKSRLADIVDEEPVWIPPDFPWSGDSGEEEEICVKKDEEEGRKGKRTGKYTSEPELLGEVEQSTPTEDLSRRLQKIITAANSIRAKSGRMQGRLSGELKKLLERASEIGFILASRAECRTSDEAIRRQANADNSTLREERNELKEEIIRLKDIIKKNEKEQEKKNSEIYDYKLKIKELKDQSSRNVSGKETNIRETEIYRENTTLKEEIRNVLGEVSSLRVENDLLLEKLADIRKERDDINKKRVKHNDTVYKGKSNDEVSETKIINAVNNNIKEMFREFKLSMRPGCFLEGNASDSNNKNKNRKVSLSSRSPVKKITLINSKLGRRSEGESTEGELEKPGRRRGGILYHKRLKNNKKYVSSEETEEDDALVGQKRIDWARSEIWPDLPPKNKYKKVSERNSAGKDNKKDNYTPKKRVLFTSESDTCKQDTPVRAKRSMNSSRKVRNPPKTAAISIARSEDATASFADVLRTAKEKLTQNNVDIGDSKMKFTAAGNLLIEIRGERNRERADEFVKILKEHVDEKITISRPEKMATIRIRGLNDAIIDDEIIESVALQGECCKENIKIIMTQKFNNRNKIVLAKCPLTTAIKLSNTGKIRISFTIAVVELLKAKPLQCYKCWQFGHAKYACKSRHNFENCCFNCGEKGHQLKDCISNSKCILCFEVGLSSDHKIGSSRCYARLHPGRINPALAAGRAVDERTVQPPND